MSSLAQWVPVPPLHVNTVLVANFQTVHLKHFSPGFRGTFKMVNVPMLRKTFCPFCKGTKPFRVTNYKSLNEEVTSRKRRLKCWWIDDLMLYIQMFSYSKSLKGYGKGVITLLSQSPTVQWKYVAGLTRGARENFCSRQSAQFVSGRPRSDVKIGLHTFSNLFYCVWELHSCTL